VRQRNTLISDKCETLNFAVDTTKNHNVLWQMLSTDNFPRIRNRSYSAHTRGHDTFLLSKPPRPALRPTQPPIQSVLRFFPGEKQPGVKLTAHLHLVPRLRMSGVTSSLPSTFSWHRQR